LAATRTTDSFREFVAASAGEFTVAKQIYVGVPSGWFSDRSACYLATGRPVVTQSTGFEKWLPVGEGLLPFTSINDAAEALNRVADDASRHARAARAIAERHFDSRTVLTELLDAVM
jgi:glycosyltransferase involved in cell wall biosynthesis